MQNNKPRKVSRAASGLDAAHGAQNHGVTCTNSNCAEIDGSRGCKSRALSLASSKSKNTAQFAQRVQSRARAAQRHRPMLLSTWNALSPVIEWVLGAICMSLVCFVAAAAAAAAASNLLRRGGIIIISVERAVGWWSRRVSASCMPSQLGNLAYSPSLKHTHKIVFQKFG